MDLVLFGIQGSGKGTQANTLARAFGYHIFEAGGELRRIATINSDLGRTVKSFIDAGNLVPHEIIMQVCAKAIECHPKEEQILFDGIPRDEAQMHDFNTIMESLHRPFRCIQIELDPEEAVQRILKRAETEGRKDDASKETILKRIKLFVEKTLPVIETYKKQGMLTSVSGNGTIEDVYQNIQSVLQ